MAVTSALLHLEPPADDLNPVPVRVQGEGQALHVSLARLLLELHAVLLQRVAEGVQVVHQETDVAKTLVWLLVATVVPEPVLGLGPMIVGQLQHRDALGVQIMGFVLGGGRRVSVAFSFLYSQANQKSRGFLTSLMYAMASGVVEGGKSTPSTSA